MSSQRFGSDRAKLVVSAAAAVGIVAILCALWIAAEFRRIGRGPPLNADGPARVVPSQERPTAAGTPIGPTSPPSGDAQVDQTAALRPEMQAGPARPEARPQAAQKEAQAEASQPAPQALATVPKPTAPKPAAPEQPRRDAASQPSPLRGGPAEVGRAQPPVATAGQPQPPERRERAASHDFFMGEARAEAGRSQAPQAPGPAVGQAGRHEPPAAERPAGQSGQGPGETGGERIAAPPPQAASGQPPSAEGGGDRATAGAASTRPGQRSTRDLALVVLEQIRQLRDEVRGVDGRITNLREEVRADISRLEAKLQALEPRQAGTSPRPAVRQPTGIADGRNANPPVRAREARRSSPQADAPATDVKRTSSATLRPPQVHVRSMDQTPRPASRIHKDDERGLAPRRLSRRMSDRPDFQEGALPRNQSPARFGPRNRWVTANSTVERYEDHRRIHRSRAGDRLPDLSYSSLRRNPGPRVESWRKRPRFIYQLECEF
jgi:hypothetical protein